MANIEAFPLHWPDGWERTDPRKRREASYQVTFDKARRDLNDELRRLGAKNVVISSDIPVRKDGQPRGTWREPEDPGIAVYWDLKNRTQVIACDKWLKIRHNLRAVGLTVSALRQLQRTGASEILDRAFLGFNALPAQGSQSSWRVLLGFDDNDYVNEDILKRRFRAMVRKFHPDQGGDATAFQKIKQAYEEGLAELQLGRK